MPPSPFAIELQCPAVRRGLPGKTGAVAGMDGRSREAKRLRAIVADLRARLPEPLSQEQLALLKRASELVLAAELARGRLCRGELVPIADVIKLENAADRACRALELLRRLPAAAKPSLSDYLKAKSAGATP
jgi:hypothetical protein